MNPFIKNELPFKITRIVLWVLTLIPFIFYGIYIFKYAVNIPFQDDYDAILEFTSHFIQAQALKYKLELLFFQHNEHRIFFDRIIFLCYYYLFGELNFRAFIVFGNSGWILTIVILMRYFQRNLEISPAYLIPVPYLLLSFCHWENMFFAMAAIQNYWFIFFAILFLISLSKNNIFLCCLFFLISLFTSGGGVVLYLIGNLYLLITRKRKSFFLFFSLSGFFIFLYFYGYHKPIQHPSILEAILNPLRTVAYLFTFWGNIFPFNASSILGIFNINFFIGALLFLASIYLVVKHCDNYFLQLAVVFIVLVSLSAALTRSGFGISQASASRYSMFSLLALTFAYILVSSLIPNLLLMRRVFLVSAVVSAVSFWGLGIYYLEHIDYFSTTKNERIVSIISFKNGDKQSLFYPDQNVATKILLAAERQHTYNYRNQVP